MPRSTDQERQAARAALAAKKADAPAASVQPREEAARQAVPESEFAQKAVTDAFREMFVNGWDAHQKYEASLTPARPARPTGSYQLVEDDTCAHCGHPFSDQDPELGCMNGWEYNDEGLPVKQGCECKIIKLSVT